MPTRRSGRLAQKASSRASSNAGDDNNSNGIDVEDPIDSKFDQQGVACEQILATVQESSPAQNSRQAPFEFDAHHIVHLMVRNGDQSVITKLTKPRLQEVIHAFADKYRSLDERVEEYQSELEKVRRERDLERDHKKTLRHAQIERKAAELLAEKMLKNQMAQANEQRAHVPVPEHSSTTDLIASDTSTALRPPTTSSHHTEASTDMELELAGEPQNTMIEHRPATASSANNDAATVPETPATKSFFARLLKPFSGYFSPSPSKTKPSLPQQPQQPLGELPVSRKRSAPDVEPEDSERSNLFTPRANPATPKFAQTAPRPRTHLNAARPSTLEPITERKSQTMNRVSRTPGPTPARRSIQQVRSEKVRRQILHDKTPSRAWERAPAPREPNADARLAKLHMVGDMRNKIKELMADEETAQIVPRAVKRLKVDELAAIPHRKPGDPESTFCVPDVDSDDEMEVDEEDVEMKTNVFEVSQAKETAKEKKQAAPVRELIQEPVRTTQPVREVAPISKPVSKAKDVWTFPSVGTRPVGQAERDLDPLLGMKFGLGLEGWKRGQQLVEW